MTKRTIVSVGLCLGLTFGAQQTASAEPRPRRPVRPACR